MSKKKRRQKRDVISIDAIGNAVDQGLLRSAATMGQHLIEHVLKTDPKIKLLLERLVKQRLERVLEKLADNKNDEGV